MGARLSAALGVASAVAVTVTPAIGPLSLTAKGLRGEARKLHTTFYWAGARKGIRYEFLRTTIGYIFVRYLPKGVPAGSSRQVLTIATYRVRGAYAQLKQKRGAISGPSGSIIWVDPRHRTIVYMAFPHGPFEIEVFDPKPAVAKATASSGRVRPIR